MSYLLINKSLVVNILFCLLVLSNQNTSEILVIVRNISTIFVS